MSSNKIASKEYLSSRSDSEIDCSLLSQDQATAAAAKDNNAYETAVVLSSLGDKSGADADELRDTKTVEDARRTADENGEETIEETTAASEVPGPWDHLEGRWREGRSESDVAWSATQYCWDGMLGVRAACVSAYGTVGNCDWQMLAI
jgi:hypothetical protein